MSENEIRVSVTVMPVVRFPRTMVGFIRRASTDTFPQMLVPPGGKVESYDWLAIYDDVPYYSCEHAAMRELEEETGEIVHHEDLKYFCTLTLPSGRVVISYYAFIKGICSDSKMIFLDENEIRACEQFAPGMKTEALKFVEFLKSINEA